MPNYPVYKPHLKVARPESNKDFNGYSTTENKCKEPVAFLWGMTVCIFPLSLFLFPFHIFISFPSSSNIPFPSLSTQNNYEKYPTLISTSKSCLMVAALVKYNIMPPNIITENS
jgi:hypothetical protein